LGIPQGAFQVIWILSGTFIASKFKNCRTIVMACWLIPTIIGVILMWKIDRKSHGVGVLFGYYLVGCYVASLVLALQMPTTNIGGYTKRITASGLVFLAYCVGNIGKSESRDSDRLREVFANIDAVRATIFLIADSAPERSLPRSAHGSL
jgi:hypothetical protein